MRTYKTVRGLLADPKRWTKNAYARRADSSLVDIHDPAACRFCLSGAIDLVYTIGRSDKVRTKVANLIRSRLLGDCLISFNDSRRTKHSDVLQIVKDAGI